MAQELKAFDVGLGRYSEDGSPCIVAFDAGQNPQLLNGQIYLKDEVDAVLAEKDAEIRRLQRALWLARAWFCGRSSEYFSGMASRCKIGQEDFYREVSERARRYMKSSYKCRAKAEEYK